MPDDPETPEVKPFHVKCDITLLAISRSEARSLAAAAVEHWNDETGWQHISGIGLPEGYVTVTEMSAERNA